MAETIVSPGVLAIENDQSFITTAPVQAGAAIVGPTVKGKVGIPTICTTYSDYSNIYGTTFESGSQTYSYFTSISVYNYFQNGGTSMLVTRVVSGSFTPATSSIIQNANTSASLVLETLTEGEIMNSDGTLNADGTLVNGTADNIRWQVTSRDINNGTFELVIRGGDDNTLTPSRLETWSNLSLDPYSSNYVEKVIGNQTQVVSNDNGEYFIDLQGDFPNQSRYVRVKKVNTLTPKYFNNAGSPSPQFTGSLPITSSGVFGSAVGTNIPSTEGKYYGNITNTNTQGLAASDYTTSISLLSNREAFRYNVITIPGLIADSSLFPLHNTVISQLITSIENRGDTIAVIDIAGYGSNILPVTTNAANFNTSYAAAYWPWTKTIDPNLGTQIWVPASTMIPGVYAFNDRVAEPWFAPAGQTRGLLPNVTRTERNLTQGNRDLLYENKVNSIATFPNTGVVVFGQKTLQKRKSALDRVNVRRLLIELKDFISQVADTLVFEQNTTNTRNTFLSQVNPYLADVQSRQGLTEYRVIMDGSNNPPSVIDNNRLVGQIYLKPTRTVEFIVLDFNVLPTGATFPT
tara:strand:- start:2304 stop:4028 length:1725 start_codon:yes stop_codon:yes gene_type:complete